MTIDSILTGVFIHLANVAPSYDLYTDMINMTHTLTIYKNSIDVLLPPFVLDPSPYYVEHTTISTKSMITNITYTTKILTFKMLTMPPLPPMESLTYVTNVEMWHPGF